MASDNEFVGVNYFPTHHNIATPPPYWLQRLYDYDNMLVVFPSIKQPYAYVLARRRQFTRGMDEVKTLAEVIDQPDTKFCLKNGLVPVSMIYRHGTTWSIDNIIATLQSRDIWRHGGAEKAADALDASEAQAEETRKKDLRDDMWQRSGQAWESYKRRTGQRVSVPGRASVSPAPTSHTSGRAVPTGSGIILTDR